MTDDELSDGELLSMAATRPDVLGVIYERHAASVFRYLARRVGAPVAEDLLGQVFEGAVGARFRVRPHESGSALPWLYGIAANVVRSHLRRTRTETALMDAVSFDWDAVDARIDAASRRDGLRTALAALGDTERELLLLVAWDGLSPTEAGQVLGLSSVAARSRLHRARARAQAALDPVAATTR